MEEVQQSLVFVGPEGVELRFRVSEQGSLRGASLDGPAIGEEGFFRELACKCGHALDTHTYHGTGCWAAIGEGYARDFCDCAAFEVAP